ncbi:hypothetical protein GHT06_020335 [Daphnia sinensis]|uniref:BED-type domain-containing protein n=1 Tax=Daphnia sinensis TaxID=1820382 RepID=A0AAD5L3G7_9CRUS|nr:hypothetical protein GHT06_020335 [Daphnia sinensis]
MRWMIRHLYFLLLVVHISQIQLEQKVLSILYFYQYNQQAESQPDRYKCMHCEKTFVRSGTGVISRHLKNKHNEKLRNLDTQSTLTKSGELVLPFKVRYLYLFNLYL